MMFTDLSINEFIVYSVILAFVLWYLNRDDYTRKSR
jgi:hypothetical protein